MNQPLNSHLTKLFISIWFFLSQTISHNFYNPIQNFITHPNPFLNQTLKSNTFYSNSKQNRNVQSIFEQMKMNYFPAVPTPYNLPNYTTIYDPVPPRSKTTSIPDFLKNLSPMKNSIFNILQNTEFVKKFAEIRPDNLPKFVSNMLSRYYIQVYIFLKKSIFFTLNLIFYFHNKESFKK